MLRSYTYFLLFHVNTLVTHGLCSFVRLPVNFQEEIMFSWMAIYWGGLRFEKYVIVLLSTTKEQALNSDEVLL